MHKVKLLFVITKLELGGAQKQLLSFITHLDRERFIPFLFTAKDGLLLPEALSIKWLRVKQSKFLERPINPLKDILTLIEIYRFIKKNNFELVHTHSSKAGILGRLAARLAKTKVIIHTVHGWSFNDFQPRPLRVFFVLLERLAAKFTDRIIVVSRWDKQKGLANQIGREGQYALIRYGIEYSEFDENSQDLKEGLGISSGNLTVGMISCFKAQKSVQDFIRLASLVIKKLPGVKFILVGDGILRKDIEKSISEYNLQESVILTGWRKDIPRILSAIDIFVLTSLWEGLPITVLEAMASSRPVIATDTGGIREVVIEGKNGFLVPPCDVKNMSQKLIVLLEDAKLRETMQRNAKASLGYDFSLACMVKNTENTYSNLLDESGVYVN
jgi:glycosyltransferase involved in cell wall biosynthesis